MQKNAQEFPDKFEHSVTCNFFVEKSINQLVSWLVVVHIDEMLSELPYQVHDEASDQPKLFTGSISTVFFSPVDFCPFLSISSKIAQVQKYTSASFLPKLSQGQFRGVPGTSVPEEWPKRARPRTDF